MDRNLEVVVMFPWLAHGHISPFLELAKKLSDRNFQTYIYSTPINLSSIKNKIPEKYSYSIKLVELHLPSSPQLPPHYHTTNGLPLHLNPTLRKALDMSKQKFSEILKALHPHLLIYDALIQWAAKISSSQNIPSMSFLTSGATVLSYFCHRLRKPETMEYPFSDIKLTDFEQAMVNGYVESVKRNSNRETDEGDEGNQDFMLIKTSREMEGKYIDYASELLMKKIIPVGPLVFADPVMDEGGSDIMEWIEKKDESSILYLSFGSEYFLKKEEIDEIAYGLEMSNVNFIWVLRFPVGEVNMRLEEALPEGFLERVGERGKIVEKWAPQAKILSHSSMGGFVSHCGWNSLMEGIEFGVPIIAMPMHLDQPINAKLVVGLGVGVEVLRDEKGRFDREEIGKVIKDVVVGELGKNLRKEAREKRERLKEICEEEIDGLVYEIKELCGKSSLN